MFPIHAEPFLSVYIMPIFIEKEKGGFKACDDKRCFSKRPMTKKQAMKQRVAIALSLAKQDNKPASFYFA